MRASSSRPEGGTGPGLAGLVGPLSPAAFLAEHWQRRAFHAPADRARLQRIEAAMGLRGLAPLLAMSRDFAVIGGGIDPRARALTHAEALGAYSGGATLYMRMGESFGPCAWARALARELGEPPLAITSLFAVRGGHGTPAHLDWNENLTVQLAGEKRWRVAAPPAGFLEHPVSNWALGDEAPAHAGPAPAPRALPSDAVEYRLTPGAVLYVPRGFLHEVAAVNEDESLSLNFSFPPSPWGVILGTLLATRLLDDPAFRESMRGAFGDGWGRDATMARLPEMLATLLDRAQGLGGELRAILEDDQRLAAYLARRKEPRL